MIVVTEKTTGRAIAIDTDRFFLSKSGNSAAFIDSEDPNQCISFREPYSLVRFVLSAFYEVSHEDI